MVGVIAAVTTTALAELAPFRVSTTLSVFPTRSAFSAPPKVIVAEVASDAVTVPVGAVPPDAVMASVFMKNDELKPEPVMAMVVPAVLRATLPTVTVGIVAELTTTYPLFTPPRVNRSESV